MYVYVIVIILGDVVYVCILLDFFCCYLVILEESCKFFGEFINGFDFNWGKEKYEGL